MGDDAAEQGFSPMRMARAGRRAGKQVAVMEAPSGPAASSTAAAEAPAAEQGRPQQPQHQLSSQGSQQDRQQQQQQAHTAQQQQFQPQPPPPQQQQQQQQQGPPPKRVGFAVNPDREDEDAGHSGQQRFAGVSRRKQEQIQREELSEAKHRNKYDDKAVEGVVDIPELEEEGKEDITRMVAQAPRAAGPRVQAMSELELDQGWLPSRPDSDDIDLSLLTACLLPSEQVIEPPDVWDYDLLFSQLKAELQSKGPAGEGGKEEKEELRQI